MSLFGVIRTGGPSQDGADPIFFAPRSRQNLIGYTWWCIIDMMEWSYREGLKPAEAYLLGMGLWDLVPDAAGVLQRVKTAAAERFRHHANLER